MEVRIFLIDSTFQKNWKKKFSFGNSHSSREQVVPCFPMWKHSKRWWIKRATKCFKQNTLKWTISTRPQMLQSFGGLVPTIKHISAKLWLRQTFYGPEPRSSGYWRRLMFQRSWVRILASYTGWTFFHIWLFWKTKNKR